MIKIRPSILIQENNQLLTMHYRYGNEDVYNLPGGNLEFGEKLTDALQRELLEELGIDVSVGELIFVGEIHLSEQKKHSVHFIFKGEILNGTPTLNPEHTSAKAIKWLTINDLKAINLYPNIAEALEKHLTNGTAPTYLGRLNQQWF